MSVVDVKNVSIRYLYGDIKKIGLKDYLIRKIKHQYNAKYFYAINDVSFKLNKGDMLGIIGSNGSGKTTLLRALSGIIEPYEGSIDVKGKVVALLNLGVGFDDELTVKENVYLRGAMLGYSEKFMNSIYQDIINFAELDEFESRAFKHLSSGMKMRLAFSIVTHIKPDILILDEVFAVGDINFKDKSFNKMKEIINSGSVTILVSHSIEQIIENCNKVLWIEKGKQITFSKDVNKVCKEYLKKKKI